MSEVMRQRKEALEAVRKTAAAVVRLRKLLREQDMYTPEALEQSVDDLMNEFFYTGRRLSARVSVLVSLRCGRLNGSKSE